MTREGHLPESSPEQPLLCLGSITARSVFQVGDGEEESFFETTGVSLDVSGALWFFSFIQDKVNMMADVISLHFFPCDHSTSHQSLLFDLCSLGFHLTVYIVNSHLLALGQLLFSFCTDTFHSCVEKWCWCCHETFSFFILWSILYEKNKMLAHHKSPVTFSWLPKYVVFLHNDDSE